MKRIIVTPGGVKRNISLLLKHLYQQKDSFDEWHIWVNTENPTNIAYINKLIKLFTWVKKIEILGSSDVGRFYPLASDPNTAYLKIDDTIVYLDPTFVSTMFKARCEDRKHMFIYANILNNPILSHLHQRHCVFEYKELTSYNNMDPVGCSSEFALFLHNEFLQSMKDGSVEKWKQSFSRWDLFNNEQLVMSAVAWIGGSFEGSILINSILGAALCVYQGDQLPSSILDEYVKLAPSILVLLDIAKVDDHEDEIALREEAVFYREEAVSVSEQIMNEYNATFTEMFKKLKNLEA